jgi:hypothetical protein
MVGVPEPGIPAQSREKLLNRSLSEEGQCTIRAKRFGKSL